jgi:hypothetical protein
LEIEIKKRIYVEYDFKNIDLKDETEVKEKINEVYNEEIANYVCLISKYKK